MSARLALRAASSHGPHPGASAVQEDPLARPVAQVLLGWAALSFLLFGLVTLAVVQGWGPVAQFDDRGSPAAEYAVDAGLADPAAPASSRSSSAPLGMTRLTLAVAVLMLVRGHRRAALFTVGVMVATTADLHS